MVQLDWFLKCKAWLALSKFWYWIVSKLIVISQIGALIWTVASSGSPWMYYWMRVLMCTSDVGHLLCWLRRVIFSHSILCSTWEQSLCLCLCFSPGWEPKGVSFFVLYWLIILGKIRLHSTDLCTLWKLISYFLSVIRCIINRPKTYWTKTTTIYCFCISFDWTQLDCSSADLAWALAYSCSHVGA